MNPKREPGTGKFSKNEYKNEDGLVLIAVPKSGEHPLSFCSLYAYLMWYFYYRIIDADNKLYTNVYSFMSSNRSTLQELKTVIAVHS